MSDKILGGLAVALMVIALIMLCYMPFVLYADMKNSMEFKVACASKGGVAVQLEYDNLCLPKGTVISVEE